MRRCNVPARTQLWQLAAANDTIKKKDEEIGKQREQLLERTKEMRDVIGSRDTLGGDVKAITDRALKHVLACVAVWFTDARLEELLQQKERLLRDMAVREEKFETELRTLKTAAEHEHMRTVAVLENELSSIRLDAQSDKIVRCC